ncbi:TonB-dependent receptor [Alkalimonas sp.]|uniref:TonB-dependent receptor n=1 Tax=Alkalimonas sp. TaxID=1872453 RepID=UPI00263A8DF9|nr:TonB-dependent receptor [Alkalimonas sp.]MCC5827223.1 TonB-dependent receptor [Alkalimonas sp.]
MHRSKIFKISVLSASVIFACSSLAAEVDSTEEEDVERIQVRGFAASQERNLNIKRFSDTIVDAVTAEDVGKFPDQTVADSLARISGVQVERSDGESDRVSIRGTAPHLNLTLLNGQNVASATASTSILTPSRGFNYSLLPSEVIQTLEVHKSAQAKIDEGSLGGTVIVRTRKPLEMERNFLAVSARMAYQDTSNKTSPLLSGFYSWKDENEDFGFNFSAVYKENNIQRDSKFTRGLSRVVRDDMTYFAPAEARASRYESAQDLTTLTAAFQFAPTDSWSFIFNNLYSKVDQENFSVANGAYLIGSPNDIQFSNLAGSLITSGRVFPNANDGNWQKEALYTANYHLGGYQTRVHDLQATYKADNYTLSFQAGFTRAKGDIKDDQVEFQAAAEADFSIVGGDVSYRFDDTLMPADYNGLYTHRNLISNAQKESYFQADLNYALNGDWFTSIDAGVKYRAHNKTSGLFKVVWHPNDLGAARLNQFTNGSLIQDFFAQGNEQHALYQFNHAAWQQWTEDTTPLREYDHMEYAFDLTENIGNAYLQGNFSVDKLRGNIGVRYARTEQTSEGFDFWMQFPWAPESWIWTPVVVERSYDDILPSLNLNYSLADDLIVRFAAAKVISRPDYDLLTSRRGYRKTAFHNPPNPGFQGNPHLDPYRANQYDLSAEYYFTRASIVSIAYFYKDISSYIDEQYFPVMLPDEAGNLDEYNLRTPVNTEGGVNQGIELNLQHNFGNGFGVLANYTYANAKMNEEGKELPNNSRHTYNATVYYDQGDWSARISYNYRDRYYAGIIGEHRWYQSGYGQIDTNISYRINQNFTAMLQVVNLGDAKAKAEVGDDGVPFRINHFGRRVFAGVRATF